MGLLKKFYVIKLLSPSILDYYNEHSQVVKALIIVLARFGKM